MNDSETAFLARGEVGVDYTFGRYVLSALGGIERDSKIAGIAYPQRLGDSLGITFLSGTITYARLQLLVKM